MLMTVITDHSTLFDFAFSSSIVHLKEKSLLVTVLKSENITDNRKRIKTRVCYA